MAFLLKLYEQVNSSELDFLATSGNPHLHLADGGLSLPAPKPQRVWGGKSIYSSGERLYESNYGNRVVTITFAIHGSTRDKVAEGWRDIVRACQDIQNYAMDFAGKHWELQFAADGAADTTYFDPLDGNADLPGDFLSVEKQHWQDGDDYYVLHDCTLTLTCKPFARGDVVEMENLILNPSFEHWNSGVSDSQPDNWSDYETATGTNNRESTSIEHGLYSLEIDVTNSGAANQYKGVTQNITTTDGFLEAGEDYTLIAWVKNAAVTNGAIRIEAYGTNTGSQYALNSGSANVSFTRYATGFTFHANDTTLTIRAYINSSASGCSGTAYIDKMILLKGSFATDTTLAYMTSSTIVNHMDTGAGHINFIDVADVPGGRACKTRFSMILPGTVSDTAQCFRLGYRKHPTIFYLDLDRLRSGESIFTSSSDWERVYEWEIVDNISHHLGKYRLFSVSYEGTTDDRLYLRAMYYSGMRGVNDKTNEPRTTGSYSNYLADLGVINFSEEGMYQVPEILGIEIQAKSAAQANMKLKELLLMPIDDYVVGKAHLPMMESDQFILDGISEIQGAWLVRSTNDRNVRKLTEMEFGESAAVYDDDLYVGTYAPGGEDSEVWQIEDPDFEEGTNLGPPHAGSYPTHAIGDYEGNIFCSQDNGEIYVYDGTSWSLSWDSPATIVYDFQQFGSNTVKLYAASDESGKIYVYDGSWADAYDSAAGAIYCLAVFKDYIYAGGDNGLVYRSADGSSWSTAYTTGEAAVKWLQPIHGYLFAGTDNDGKVFKTSDGTSWSQTGGTPTTDDYIHSSCALGDVIYCVTEDNLYWSDDLGESWTTVADVGSGGIPVKEIIAWRNLVWIFRSDELGENYLVRSHRHSAVSVPAQNLIGKPLRFIPEIDQRVVLLWTGWLGLWPREENIHVRIAYEPQFLHIRVG